MKFTVIKACDNSRARLGTIVTSRGSVSTPVFMPVATRGTVRAMSTRDIQEIGFEIILSNTYHMYIRPGLEVLERAGGLHNFMNYHKPVLTDSGGFQVYSLANLRRINDDGIEFRSHIDGSSHFFTPEKVLDIQKIIGSDIMMILDECSDYPVTEAVALDGVERTVQWAKQSIEYWKERFDPRLQTVFAIIQGSTYQNLRKICTEELLKLDFPGYAIGGLSVGEPKSLYREITEFTLQLMPFEKPRYMMGVGSPMEILYAVKHGVDMFDCVMPTRIARNGTLYTSEGRINIKNSRYEFDFDPLDKNCDCFVCRTFTRSYLRHIFKMNEISALLYNTYHNLYFMKTFMDKIRCSIENNLFNELYNEWDAIYSKN
jgi:queuine tRNA-ribosyltransferase